MFIPILSADFIGFMYKMCSFALVFSKVRLFQQLCEELEITINQINNYL